MLMEKVENYIYAVTKRLPEKQRAAIEEALRSRINKMLDAGSGDGNSQDRDIDEVLLELGDPALLAESYRVKRRYLIGPENYDIYFLLLKIVIAAVAFGITLAFVISNIVTPPESIGGMLTDYFGGLISAIFSVFAWVTILFAVFEHFEVDIRKEVKGVKWSPQSLPPLPVVKAGIKPSEAIVWIVFTVLAIILFNTAHHLIAIYLVSDDAPTRLIPLFNLEVFRSVLPLLNIMFALGITRELLKLVARKWTFNLALFNIFANLASLGLFIFFIGTEGLWNEEFLNYWVDIGILSVDADPMALWSRIITGFTILIAFAFLLDSVVNLVKGVKNKASE